MPKTLTYVILAFVTGALTGALAVAGYSGGTATPPPAPPEVESALAVRALPEKIAAPEPEADPSPVSEAAAPKTDPPPADPALAARVAELSQGWARLEGEISRLQARIDGLERRVTAVSPTGNERTPTPAADPADERRSALVKAGLAEDLAADLVWREAQAELDRLELRDLALREGWFNTDRYREELSRIQAEAPKLRETVGDEMYDRYLFAAGEPNRVRVASVIPGSAAEDAGLRAGDLIETYEGGRIFSFGELRSATSAGERGELVAVQIRRADGSRLQAWLPRGPLGIRLDMTRADPDA